MTPAFCEPVWQGIMVCAGPAVAAVSPRPSGQGVRLRLLVVGGVAVVVVVVWVLQGVVVVALWVICWKWMVWWIVVKERV